MAAKLIQLSDDAKVTFETLPGNTGSFNNDAEQIDDTVLGQTFQSSEVGLIGWSVEANAFYKGFAGYITTILKPDTSTVLTTEAMSLEAGQIYQIDDEVKEIWDRNGGAFTIFDTAVDKNAEVDWIDYLFGRVKFVDSYTVTGAVTVTGFYWTKLALGTANAFTLTQTADPIDNTDFATAQANGGLRTFEPGLRTVQFELSGFYALANAFLADLKARNEVIIEINPDGVGTTGSKARGFFKIQTEGQAGDVGALEEETTVFNLAVPIDDGTIGFIPAIPGPNIPFGWQHEAASPVAEAIKIALIAWQNEATIDVQYLEDGLAGINGACIITDISLTGGLSVMNEYSVTAQGTGAQVIV